MRQIDDITVHVRDAHLANGWDWDSDNPITRAVMDALTAPESPYRTRLPDGTVAEVLTTEDGRHWIIALFAHMGAPWNGSVRLLFWKVCDPQAVDQFDNLAYGGPDEVPTPFSFSLSFHTYCD